MDQERFDHLARDLAAGITRRGMVRNLTGAALGGVLVAVGGGDAAARNKRKRGKRGAVRAQAKGGGGGGGKCPRANRCGNGKRAQCCTGNERCNGGVCEIDTRTVSLSFDTFDQFHTHCWVTVNVTGFAEGSYAGFVDPLGFTVDVGADGTGSWTSRTINTIWGAGGATEATVDGVSSGPVDLVC